MDRVSVKRESFSDKNEIFRVSPITTRSQSLTLSGNTIGMLIESVNLAEKQIILKENAHNVVNDILST